MIGENNEKVKDKLSQNYFNYIICSKHEIIKWKAVNDLILQSYFELSSKTQNIAESKYVEKTLLGWLAYQHRMGIEVKNLEIRIYLKKN